MSGLPSQQKALFLESRLGKLAVGHHTVPKPGRGQLLIKVKAIALNHLDYKIQKYETYSRFMKDYPAILGSDFSGDVAVVGEGVTKFKVGDKIMGQGKFGNDTTSYQEYTLADEEHTAKIPSNVNYEQAAALPVAIATSYLGLYNKRPHGVALVSPIEPSGLGYYKGTPFVVLGGASSVGQAVIQFTKLSGFNPIIVTASPQHTEYLKSLGATHVLDRKLSTPNLKAEINKITPQPIQNVFDVVASSETQETGIEILASGGQFIVVMEPVVFPGDKQITRIVGIRGLEFNHGPFTDLYTKFTEFVEKGIIKPNKIEVLPGGLHGIIEGLEKLEESKASCVKLVVRPEETQ